jgi:hypothetical protein
MATLDVLRYSGDLKIATVAGGTMTLDTGVSSGTVVITGNLNVLGTQTNVSTTNTNIKDNIIILNYFLVFSIFNTYNKIYKLFKLQLNFYFMVLKRYQR